MVVIAIWMLFNHFCPHLAFDDAAFDFLKLGLLIEASLAGSVLLMSHHKHYEADRKIMYNDYMLDYQIRQQLKEIRPMIEDIHKRDIAPKHD